MKYFLHDSNSFNDEKITELFLNFGYEGLGLFYTLLEKISSQEKPIKTSVLKSQLKVGKRLEKCWVFMEKIDLISSNNGETFNKHLLNFSEMYRIKKEKNAKRILEWREKQQLAENVTRSKNVRNAYKVNISKVNISKEEKNIQLNFNFVKSLSDLGIEKKIIGDWLKVRKEKKASNTETAFKAISREIEKSGKSANECITIAVERSWSGFKAEWIETDFEKKKNNDTETTYYKPIKFDTRQ